jgi:hypothetical protein
MEIMGPVLVQELLHPLGGDHIRVVEETGPRDLSRLFGPPDEFMNNALPDDFGDTRLLPPSLGVHQLCKIIG